MTYLKVSQGRFCKALNSSLAFAFRTMILTVLFTIIIYTKLVEYFSFYSWLNKGSVRQPIIHFSKFIQLMSSRTKIKNFGVFLLLLVFFLNFKAYYFFITLLFLLCHICRDIHFFASSNQYLQCGLSVECLCICM